MSSFVFVRLEYCFIERIYKKPYHGLDNESLDDYLSMTKLFTRLLFDDQSCDKIVSSPMIWFNTKPVMVLFKVIWVTKNYKWGTKPLQRFDIRDKMCVKD